MRKYFIEFLGVIVVLYAKLLTHANPIVMGIVYISLFFIGQDILTGFYSPLTAVASYALGRSSSQDMLYNILSQTIGMVVVILSFKPIHDMIL